LDCQIKFGAKYARRLKRKNQGYGDTFYVDEVVIKINGKQHYLWRAIDQDGEVVDGPSGMGLLLPRACEALLQATVTKPWR
jgi:hypothetical protein